jgi:hypothetical protein
VGLPRSHQKLGDGKKVDRDSGRSLENENSQFIARDFSFLALSIVQVQFSKELHHF